MNTNFNVRPPDNFVFDSIKEEASFAIVSYTLDPHTETLTRQIGDVTFSSEQKVYLHNLFDQLAKTNSVIDYDVLEEAGNRRFTSKLYDDLDKRKEEIELQAALALSTCHQETKAPDLDLDLEAALKFSLQS